MNREEALKLLKAGSGGITTWNEGRKREAGDGLLLDFSGAVLFAADLSGAKLIDAKLSGADLSGADLSRANLFVADLSGADLSGAKLIDAKLSGADLSGAKLIDADLSGAKLIDAKLSGADLSGAKLIDANLSGADLSRANLTLARLIRAQLANAVVEDAIVEGVQVHELRGLPRPPCKLRLGTSTSSVPLTGEDAANFFVLPAVVEVLLTPALADAELGCLHFHLGEVRAQRVAADVYLVGHRREAGGSVLRFQGPTYDAVYAALPDLLAAFRTAAAVDWAKTFESANKDERGEPVAALVKAESRLKAGRWRLADRLASAFEGFADARVVKLVDGRRKGITITVVTDDAVLEKLTRAALPSAPTGAALVFQGPSTHYHGDAHVSGDTFNVGGNVTGAALGRGASLTAEQIITNIRQSSERSADADLVAAVRQALDAIAGAKLADADQVEAAETVEKVQKEAEKPDADAARPGRVKRWLDALAAICKPAADAISAAKAVIVALGK